MLQLFNLLVIMFHNLFGFLSSSLHDVIMHPRQVVLHRRRLHCLLHSRLMNCWLFLHRCFFLRYLYFLHRLLLLDLNLLHFLFFLMHIRLHPRRMRHSRWLTHLGWDFPLCLLLNWLLLFYWLLLLLLDWLFNLFLLYFFLFRLNLSSSTVYLRNDRLLGKPKIWNYLVPLLNSVISFTLRTTVQIKVSLKPLNKLQIILILCFH